MDLVFIFIILLFVIVYFNTNETEDFTDTPAKIGDMTMSALEEKIYQIYKADVLAIKNLADTATKLQTGGLTIDNITITSLIGRIEELEKTITLKIDTSNVSGYYVKYGDKIKIPRYDDIGDLPLYIPTRGDGAVTSKNTSLKIQKL
jgi:hypothetical protein